VNVAERLIAQARHGRFDELLPELLDLARRPKGSRNPVWEATAAAIQILFWQDRFAEAAELAENLILRDGPLAGELCDQTVPFRSAFLAAERYAGEPARPRLLAAAERVPEGRNLRTDLLWVADQLPDRPIEELLPNAAAWGGPATSPDGLSGAHLLDREYTSLTPREQRLVWQTLAGANLFGRAHELAESSGDTPPQFAVCTWLAGWYATEGDLERGERMLLAARLRWWPFATWDAIPDPPVLQPALRLVVTDRVREDYLTRPIGPEAGSDQR